MSTVFAPLLIQENPLQVLPSLATAIGLNEAIALQQVHYWLNHNAKDPVKARTHFRDGKWWTYNTYKEWKETNFQFWSVPTIKRTFTSLEKKGVLISYQFNKAEGDFQKWYTIDYEVASRLTTPSDQIDPTPDHPSDQIDLTPDHPSDQIDPTPDHRSDQIDLTPDHPSDQIDPTPDHNDHPSDQIDPTLRSKRSDPEIRLIPSYTETNSEISSETNNRDLNPPLTPQRGNECETPSFSSSKNQTPSQALSTVDSEAQQLASDENSNSEQDKGSARKKQRFPQLTEKRISSLKAVWNEVATQASWWSGWQATDNVLKDALKVFWATCHEQQLDPNEVLKVALLYARDKSPFWGSPPPGGGKWTPIKLLRKKKGHIFSLYAEAIAPESSHPYPHLEGRGLAGVWVGPGPLDFDLDLITVISRGRESAGKAFDDSTCKLSVEWMISNNKFSMLQQEWSKATERKQAIATNRAAREAADIRDGYKPCLQPEKSDFGSWFDWAKVEGHVHASQQSSNGELLVLVAAYFNDVEMASIPEHWLTYSKARELFPPPIGIAA